MTEVPSRKGIHRQADAAWARVQYYRDLGIYDFYRRGEPLENAFCRWLDCRYRGRETQFKTLSI